jgi:hypothetical protein
MSAKDPKYDVAISFLYRDLNLAKALVDELSKGLEIFFFPRNQEELAGTDGLESMREPFRNESRLNVILYRPQWGKTPWTAVEEIAVMESCLETRFKSLFFFVIEATTELPNWLPETHVRFNYADFGLEQAAGAIKLRVQERGGHIRPLTPTRKAELLKAEDDFRRNKAGMLSSTAPIFKEVEALFVEIRKQCDDVNAESQFNIQYSVNVRQGIVDQTCIIGQDHVSMSIIWYQPYGNSFEHASLVIREFDQQLIIPPGYIHWHKPEMLKETKHSPDVSRTLEYGWQLKQGHESFISTKDLATRVVLQFLELIERDRSGKINRKQRY